MNIQNIIKELKTRNIFITGGGGVGKSYTVNKLKNKLDLIITSSTGISAVNIGGQTIHAWTGIGIADKPISSILGRIKRNTSKYNEILKAEYLVIDEISMLNSYTMDYLNEVLKQLRETEKAFGGIKVILVGDFYQLPPVKIGETVRINNSDRLIDYAFNSVAWKELNPKVIALDKVYRQADKEFVNTLNRIRIGKCTNQDEQLLLSRDCKSSWYAPKEAVKLYGVNYSVEAENERRFNELSTPIFTFKAKDKINCFLERKQREEWLNPESEKVPEWDKRLYDNFNKDCRIPKVLKLRKGARVMLLNNSLIDIGLVNGSCGNVIEVKEDIVRVKFDCGISHIIAPDELEIYTGRKKKITRIQYPLRLAYASTIHKAQGLTLDKVYIDFKNIFAGGQAYVALSRVKTLEGLYISNFNSSKVFADKEIKSFYGDE